MDVGPRARGWGRRANEAAHQAAARVDDTTGDATQRLAAVIVPTVRLLRWPTGALVVVPLPFVLTVVVLGLRGSGWSATVLTVLGVAMALVSAAFWGRRRKILQAVEDPAALSGELRTLVNLTGRIDETGATLQQIAGGGGWRLFSRLRGAWRGASMPARWLEQVGELPRARYFAPPKIGTTVTVTVAALWLVPVSIVLALVAVVGTVAGSF